MMLDETDPRLFITVRKLVAASLLEVFKDIVPGYKIRPPTEKERQQKMTKETRQLVGYEESLLRQYRHYLTVLVQMTQGLKSKKTSALLKRFPSLSEDTAEGLGLLALRCLCDLLLTIPHFNYRSNITSEVIFFMAHKNKEVSELCCETVRRIYKQDRLGEISLEIVRQTTKMVKERNYSVNPEVLRTFLSLKIKDVDLNKEAEAEKKSKKFMTYKEKKQRLSRMERKKTKQMEQVDKDLQETKAEESKQKKNRLYTEITKQVFLTYFGVLKKATSSVLLSAVLEGLARFAHLINIEFFDDLFKLFHNLIESGALSYRERLHCVQTVFTILSGQGDVLNVDPLSFYTHLYNSLFHLHAGESSEDVPTALSCLEIMLIKRKKKISKQRVLAFTKRLSTLCLQLLHNGAVSCLAAVCHYMHNHLCTEILLDPDCQHGSGLYLPELEEPEHCNAQNTALWELHILKRHYHQAVQRLATHALSGSPLQLDRAVLPGEIGKRSAEDLFSDYSPAEMAFKPAVPAPVKMSSTTLKKNSNKLRHLKLQERIDTTLGEGLNLDVIDFSSILDRDCS